MPTRLERRRASASIHALPNEVLLLVFRAALADLRGLVADSPWEASEPSLRHSAVCRRWRVLCLSTRWLWTRVDIDTRLDHREHLVKMKVSNIVERSRDAPLQVRIHFHATVNLHWMHVLEDLTPLLASRTAVMHVVLHRTLYRFLSRLPSTLVSLLRRPTPRLLECRVKVFSPRPIESRFTIGVVLLPAAPLLETLDFLEASAGDFALASYPRLRSVVVSSESRNADVSSLADLPPSLRYLSVSARGAAGGAFGPGSLVLDELKYLVCGSAIPLTAAAPRGFPRVTHLALLRVRLPPFSNGSTCLPVMPQLTELLLDLARPPCEELLEFFRLVPGVTALTLQSTWALSRLFDLWSSPPRDRLLPVLGKLVVQENPLPLEDVFAAHRFFGARSSHSIASSGIAPLDILAFRRFPAFAGSESEPFGPLESLVGAAVF